MTNHIPGYPGDEDSGNEIDDDLDLNYDLGDDQDSDGEPFDAVSPDITPNNVNFLGRISLTLDSSVFANVFSRVTTPIINALTIDIKPLFRLLGYDDRSDTQQFAEDEIVIVDSDIPPEKDDKVRGPYYGYDAFLSKLSGMKSAWHYITDVTRVQGDIVDVYYITIDAPKYTHRPSGTSKRKI